VKLLLDQGLPRTAATDLAKLGWDVVHVGEIGLAAATDQEILRRALAEQRAIVTLDADFHTILALENASGPSVIRVRIEGLRGVELAALILRVVQACEADLNAGAMVTVKEAGVRVRALPVFRS
jgi:predicted nuclease of predicted toxin-antitoxin system